MDAIYYWLGFVVFWLWCGLLAYYGICSLLAELIEYIEARDQ